MRLEISTGTPSEQRVGYARAVRVDNRIYFSGTTSQNREGRVIGDDVYAQAHHIFSTFDGILIGQGFSRNDIASVTAYLVDMNQLPDFDRAYREYFQESHPACTLVGVSQLVDPNMLIEISCIADQSAK